MPKVKQGRKNAGKPATPRRTRKAGTGSASSTSVVEEDVAGAGTSIINGESDTVGAPWPIVTPPGAAHSSEATHEIQAPSHPPDTPVTLPIYDASGITPPTQPAMLSCVCDELGSEVPLGIKEKIWSGEYFDLGLLLKRDGAQLDSAQSFSLCSTGAAVVLRPHSKPPVLSNIEQWTSAFLIFASIYLERHPARARELLKYMDIVRSIVRYGGVNWRSYDAQFRLRQARHPFRSWASIDSELWLTITTAITIFNIPPRHPSPPGASPFAHTGGEQAACPRLGNMVQTASASPDPRCSVTHSMTPGHAAELTAVFCTDAETVPQLPMAPTPASNPPPPPVANGCQAQTPINLKRMLRFLNKYARRDDAAQLISGFRFGFSLGFTGLRHPVSSRNLKSAGELKDILKDKIQKEISLGRIAGPFQNPPFPNFRCSPIGLVPKRTPGEFRLIQHLSAPRGQSVNEFINSDLCSVSYTSFDEAVNLVSRLGQGAFMGKADIKSAFRLLPVHPSDFELLGFCVDGEYFYDKCLPMGCAISCAHFERFSTFLESCCRNLANTDRILHYLDDFFFAGASREECESSMRHFLAMCEAFGVPIASEKTEGPVSSITFLGLEIDAIAMKVRVPSQKIDSLQAALRHCEAQKKLTLRQLQSLIGSLNFVCKAVAPGRAFLRRLIDLTRGVRRPEHRIRISKGARADLQAWALFLSEFNGTVMFSHPNWRSNTEFQFFTDAAASIGFGIFFQNKWAQGRWPAAILDAGFSIAFLELFPIVAGIRLWGARLANNRVLFWSDNQTVVHVVNSQTSKCKHIMKLVRILVGLCLKYNILFRARYVPGSSNEIADSLSRFQMERFRQLAPGADQRGCVIPIHLWRTFL
ncbi:uncharacterized protein LOC121415240 [Lytechinus variegatus]|uniref:uncharacterized protein LOC121415240 n=1 Tax=Lytechinus variegatus TaxID=7654 RepID=UPI001BB0F272|nr:uncharacterized protein LOC121415240 [Lytechinus variegatus]